jgi:hypothetical protein
VGGGGGASVCVYPIYQTYISSRQDTDQDRRTHYTVKSLLSDQFYIPALLKKCSLNKPVSLLLLKKTFMRCQLCHLIREGFIANSARLKG